jgi:Mrp family chromosome partitioning ATPase
MKLFLPSSNYAIIGTDTFDMLRAKLEFEVAPPAVIAITSSTAEDGKEIVARGLAYSLATAGYATLLLDTCLASRSPSMTPQRLTFEEAGRQLTPESGPGIAVLNLGDLLMQKVTSHRHILSALEILRSKFDYVIINTDCGGATAFAATVVASADVVLVTVKEGRRKTADDARLSGGLEHIGPRFLGVVALDPSIIKDDPTIAPVPDAISDWRRGGIEHVNKEHQPREIVEWQT